MYCLMWLQFYIFFNFKKNQTEIDILSFGKKGSFFSKMFWKCSFKFSKSSNFNQNIFLKQFSIGIKKQNSVKHHFNEFESASNSVFFDIQIKIWWNILLRGHITTFWTRKLNVLLTVKTYFCFSINLHLILIKF